MKRYLLDITINDAQTGEFIEKVGIYYVDYSEQYADVDEIQEDALANSEKWEEIVYDCRETKPHADEILTVEGIELENEPEDEEDDDNESDCY